MPLVCDFLLQAWAEDFEEFVEAIETYRKQHRILGEFSIWICTYSNYRAYCQPRAFLDI